MLTSGKFDSLVYDFSITSIQSIVVGSQIQIFESLHIYVYKNANKTLQTIQEELKSKSRFSKLLHFVNPLDILAFPLNQSFLQNISVENIFLIPTSFKHPQQFKMRNLLM
jgi:hypothetical protein